MASQITCVVLAERPKADIVPGKTFRVETRPAPTEADLKDGELLVETLYVSLDPAMRGWLNDSRSYLKPVQIGEIMRSVAVSRVLASRAPEKAQAGDIVTTLTGWTEVAITSAKGIVNFRHLLAALPEAARSRLHMTDLLGPLGTTGLTAYFGMAKVAGTIKPTDTVVISAAAGATGSIAAQIAKMQGAKRVIGIAGGEDKARWLEEHLGLDVGLNYKDPDFAKKFAEATPDYIDVYWDNGKDLFFSVFFSSSNGILVVGGEILELALTRAATHARFVMCGGISQYNAGGQVQGPKNYLQIIMQRIK